MLRAEGYSVITTPGERDIEHDTTTCGHCSAITFTKAGLNGPMQVLVMKRDGTHEMRDAGFCRTCWRNICPRCVGFACEPLEKKVEAEERASRRIIW